MTEEEFRALGPGDIVLPTDGGAAVMVTVNYGGRATAVRTYDLTNPLEWALVRKVQTEERR